MVPASLVVIISTLARWKITYVTHRALKYRVVFGVYHSLFNMALNLFVSQIIFKQSAALFSPESKLQSDIDWKVIQLFFHYS